MFAIFGFYKFKKITNLNTKKQLLEKLFKIEKIRGSITLSSEGVNSAISFNYNQYGLINNCLLYTSPSPRDLSTSRMPSSA